MKFSSVQVKANEPKAILISKFRNNFNTFLILMILLQVMAIDSLVLPFSDVIDWKRFSIRIHEIDLPKIFDVLNGVSEKRRHELRHQGLILLNFLL